MPLSPSQDSTTGLSSATLTWDFLEESPPPAYGRPFASPVASPVASPSASPTLEDLKHEALMRGASARVQLIRLGEDPVLGSSASGLMDLKPVSLPYAYTFIPYYY